MEVGCFDELSMSDLSKIEFQNGGFAEIVKGCTSPRISKFVFRLLENSVVLKRISFVLLAIKSDSDDSKAFSA